MNRPRRIPVCLLLLCFFLLPVMLFGTTEKPNVVLILTDNHGAWTLGCYGNPDIRTPNLDRLASQGIRFTRALASNPVCSPTRATLLTGLIPSQHGVHSFLGGETPNAQMGPDAYCTIGEFATIPKVMAEAGYTTGMTGKWHLGANLTPQEGFSYWVTMPYGGTRTFYNADVIENGEVRQEPTYLTDFWTDHAIRFIEENHEDPFFLYLPYNGPYVLGGLLLRLAQNRHAEYYADKLLLSFPRDRMHPWQYNNKEYLNNPISIQRAAAEVSGIDDGVGAVMATLERLGLDDNTIVIFLGDQGWMGGQNGLWGMGDHTRPFGAHDLMMQIPLIVRHPGKIPAGQTSDRLVSNYDVMPSLLSYLGLKDKIPSESPGRDFSEILTGREIPWEDAVFYEMENTRAIRTDGWKYVARNPSGPYELYDMNADPQERFNLFGQKEHSEKQQELALQLDEFFEEYADPEYDLWKGGRTKAGRLGEE